MSIIFASDYGIPEPTEAQILCLTDILTDEIIVNDFNMKCNCTELAINVSTLILVARYNNSSLKIMCAWFIA